ncbi:MAG: efflux RND transporter periplasmic adaptor subunit [Deltaproteobacteria bacterium]|nr:efflux RND transporter periplasmic adaptor subunit [Deltaproteobacteria bacterium]
MAMAGKRFQMLIGIGLVIILGALALIAAYPRIFKQPAAVAYMETTGEMEAVEVELSTKLEGALEWMCCDAGSAVKTGDAAFRLESDELKARLVEGEAVALSAMRSLGEARIGLENASAALEAQGHEAVAAKEEALRVKALADEAQENLGRVKGLIAEGFVSKKEMDAAQAHYDSLKAQHASATARQKSSAVAVRNSGINIKAANARIETAEALVAEKQARIKVIQTQLADSTVRSPINGVIALKSFEAGERAQAGASVYTVVDLDNIWARVDIDETRIPEIRLGNRAEVFVRNQKPVEAVVTEISELAAFATQRDVTRGRSDIKSFRVKARITKPDGTLKPGMTVTVRFHLDNR